jgi:uncharacterized lipoprotein YbaY
MKRFLVPFVALALLIQLTGCDSSSSNTPVPTDGSNLPDEVKEQEKREQDRAKGIRTKVATPPSQNKVQGARAGEPGAK